MKILLTGGTGFVGNYVIRELINHNHLVTCIYRNKKKLELFSWKDKVELINADIYEDISYLKNINNPDALIHLAWSGLPNYQSDHHTKLNLPGDIKFLKRILNKGIKQILVTGTCFEFGKQYGPLSPNMPTYPDNPYAVAKDELRKWLQAFNHQNDFILQWVRLFYMYGIGQNYNSIISQLDRAIDNKENIFNMSGGEQLRDYLKITEVAKRLVNLIENPNINGIQHCCNGEPISIRRLVEEHIKKRNSSIKVNLGYYPYPEYEAMAFWGNN